MIDFKVDELTHQDLGQMQMYVNYYDRYEIIEGESFFEDICQSIGDCGITGRFANNLAGLPEGLRFYFQEDDPHESGKQEKIIREELL